MVTKEWKNLMNIGFTGHQHLPKQEDWQWVRKQVEKLLSKFSLPIIGICSLAIGADQLFANTLLHHNGQLRVIVPFLGYEMKFTVERDQQEYLRLLQSATHIEILEKLSSDEESYWNAGKHVIDLSDLVIAVWNGKPAAGLGGTADVVDYAIKNAKPLIHIHPTLHLVIDYTTG